MTHDTSLPDTIHEANYGRVDKPWGYELRWIVADRYVGKLIHINKGEALSLQYHNVKDESIFVVKGCLELYLENDEGTLEIRDLTEGMSCHVHPGKKHRFVGKEDTDLVEVSTPELDDVVRLEDRYGREGTVAP